MNMKKLIAMLVVAMVGMSAFAEYTYLYWAVSPLQNEFWQRRFDAAYVGVVDGDGNFITKDDGTHLWLDIYDAQNNGPYAGMPSDPETGYTSLPAFADVTDYASSPYGFIIEAYLEGELAWTSGVTGYDQLLANDHIWKGDPSSMAGDILPWSAQIPEPSSALMLLLGLASLALKRKKEK